MSIEKVERVNVGDQVFEQMKRLILSGEWKSGERIPGENELVRLFGVSRVSVRAAIHQLVGMGVLLVRHGEGTFVAADPVGGRIQSLLLQQMLLSQAQLREVLEFRLMTEVGSARLAARNATQADIVLLRACEAALRKAGNDPDAFARCDLEYHNTLALVSGNSLMVRVTAVIQDIYSRAMLETIRLRGLEVGRYNHTPITDAIQAHDGEKAAALMEAHIQAVLDLLA